MDALFDAADLFTPAGVMNYIDPNNKSPEDVDGTARSFIAGTMAALGHKFISVDPDMSLRVASSDLSMSRRNATRDIKDTLASLGPSAAFEQMTALAQEERELATKLGNVYEAAIAGGMSPREANALLKDAGMDAKSISNIRNMAYTSESDVWVSEYSKLLSPNALRNPPIPKRVMNKEERKEWEAEYKEQAKEVARRMKVLNKKEKN